MKRVYKESREVNTSHFRVEAWVQDDERDANLPAMMYLYQGAPNDREGLDEAVIDEWSILRWAGETQAIREAIKRFDAAQRKFIESLAEAEVEV